MGMTIEDAIRKIVKKVPKRRVFDSHFLMNRLIKEYSDQYLSFAGRFAGGEERRTLAAHGQIGKKINRLRQEGLIEEGRKAWSENIHGKPSPCTCWERR